MHSSGTAAVAKRMVAAVNASRMPAASMSADHPRVAASAPICCAELAIPSTVACNPEAACSSPNNALTVYEIAKL